MNKNRLEKKVEQALENGCAYHACGNYRRAMEYTGEAYAYLDLLEDIGVWYEDTIINEHCQNMIDILENSVYLIEFKGVKE